MKRIFLISIILLAGCNKAEHNDIKKWMEEKTATQKRIITQLPPAKTFIPVPFIASSDPFKEKPLVVLNAEKSKYAPDLDRRKEPLESYQVANIKMTGTLIKDNIIYAMILAPDGTINYVTKNNYIGVNYGKIVSITESEIQLDERVKNSNEEWQPKKTIIVLDEGSKK